MKIRGTKLRALLDNGSGYSLMSNDWARCLRLKIIPITEETNHCHFSANGIEVQMLGTTDISLEIRQLKSHHTVYICATLSEPFILGRELLSDSGAVLQFRNRTVIFNDVLDVPLQQFVNKDS